MERNQDWSFRDDELVQHSEHRAREKNGERQGLSQTQRKDMNGVVGKILDYTE